MIRLTNSGGSTFVRESTKLWCALRGLSVVREPGTDRTLSWGRLLTRHSSALLLPEKLDKGEFPLDALPATLAAKLGGALALVDARDMRRGRHGGRPCALASR
mmetsp:Transcript_14519/g.41595  ORF Transcript_14519/g.41595 Transcript_14519/m.41595 type:complete len:103 (-) Transcript_14519:51-359(-)